MQNIVHDDFRPWVSASDRRGFRRWSVDTSAFIDIDDTSNYCVISDISPVGVRARLLGSSLFDIGEAARLDLEGYEPIAARVRHSTPAILGLSFELDRSAQIAFASWLLSVNLARRQPRYSCRIAASLTADGASVPCTVVDLSRQGAKVRVSDTKLLLGAENLALKLAGHPALACKVRHVVNADIGLLFFDNYEGEIPQ